MSDSISSLPIKPGDILPSIVKHLNQENINLYAEASGDFNPIHVDQAFASQTALGGTIAHGMLILAYISEMMTLAFKDDWLSGGKLSIRFKKPACPGDIVTASGKVNSIESKDDTLYVLCQVFCHNQKGDILILGEAEVELHREDA